MDDQEEVQSPTARVLRDVMIERARQDNLKAAGRFQYTCADPGMVDVDRVACLGEEFGEACRALLESRHAANDVHGKDLRKELIQVAAVAVAWVEYLDWMAARV